MKKFLSILLTLSMLLGLAVSPIAGVSAAIGDENDFSNFKVDKATSKILDPDGNELLLKGVNVNGPGWCFPRGTLQDVNLIVDTWKFNSVRLCAATKWDSWAKKYNNNDVDNFDTIIDAFTSRGIVVILENHDYTGIWPPLADNGGYTTGSGDIIRPLRDLKTWWVDLAEKYKDNPYVWFNIMNEPGAGDSKADAELWYMVHDEVITAIRETGAENIIVLDDHNWGQASGYMDRGTGYDSAVIRMGPALNEKWDNLVFSLHVYDAWRDGKERFDAYFADAKALGLCVILGEYGVGTNSLGQHNAVLNMFNSAIENEIGRFYWAWDDGGLPMTTSGNNRGWSINKTDGSKPTNLTWAGEMVWLDNRGELTSPVPRYNLNLPLLTNGSFDSNMNGWGNWGGCSVSSSTAGSYNGTRFLQIAAGGSGGCGRDVVLEPGKTYRLSAVGYGVADLGIKYNYTIEGVNGGNEFEYHNFINFTATDKWEEKFITFTTQEDMYVTLGTIFIWKSDSSVFRIDNIELYEVIVSDISIKTEPTKLVYEIGEQLDISGLVLNVNYTDRDSDELVVRGIKPLNQNNDGLVEVSGFDSDSAGTKIITVIYNGCVTTFDVTINGGNPEPQETIAANFEGIEGVTVKYYTNAAGWKTVGIYDNISEFEIPEEDKATSGATTIQLLKGGMYYSFTLEEDKWEYDIPVKTIKVTGISESSSSKLGIAQNDWVYRMTDVNGESEYAFNVFDNGADYFLKIGGTNFAELTVSGVNAGDAVDISEYYYDIAIPGNISNVRIGSGGWWYPTPGTRLTLLKTGQSAVVYFSLDGKAYEIPFKFDGMNPFEGLFIVNFPGVEGVTMQYYKGSWSTVSGTFDNAAMINAAGATSVRAVKGGMTYQVDGLGKAAYPNVIDVPVGTITVKGIGFDCNLSIVGSNWVYQNIACTAGEKTFNVFGGRTYELQIAKSGFHTIKISGQSYDAMIDISEYFYEITVPDGVTNLRLQSNNWIADYLQSAIKPGKTINLLKTNNTAKMSFVYNGESYNIDFKLDGTNPFDGLFGNKAVIDLKEFNNVEIWYTPTDREDWKSAGYFNGTAEINVGEPGSYRFVARSENEVEYWFDPVDVGATVTLSLEVTEITVYGAPVTITAGVTGFLNNGGWITAENIAAGESRTMRYASNRGNQYFRLRLPDYCRSNAIDIPLTLGQSITINANDYFDTFVVPEGFNGVNVSVGGGWVLGSGIECNIAAGDELILLRSGQEAQLWYNYNGGYETQTYAPFLLDGSNPFDGLIAVDIVEDVGNLEEFEDALIALGANPGATLRFTADITLTQEWIEAHDWEWFDETGAGAYVDVIEIDEVGSYVTLTFFNVVNIDLNGYTWDLSMLTGTGLFADPGYGSCGISFYTSTDDPIPHTICITNGTIIANYMFFNLDSFDELTLTDSFITNAEIWISSPDEYEYIPYDSAIHTNVHDYHTSY